MKSHTEVVDVLEFASRQSVIHKVEVDALRDAANRAFKSDMDAIVRESHAYAGKYVNFSEVEKKLYDALPYDLRQCASKKFHAAVNEAGIAEVSAFIADVVYVFYRWKDIPARLQALKDRQKPGRRPAPPKKVIGTRTQLRAECSLCGSIQAIHGGRMYDHGFDIASGFRNRVCNGANHYHFGTAEGRNWAAHNVEVMREEADSAEHRAICVLNGEIPANVLPKFPGEHAEKQIRYMYADNLKRRAAMARAYADRMERRVKAWEPKDPIEVEIEITEAA